MAQERDLRPKFLAGATALVLALATFTLLSSESAHARRSGISPQDYGADYELTPAQIATHFHPLRGGHYEYGMSPQDFSRLQLALRESGLWQVDTRPFFHYPETSFAEGIPHGTYCLQTTPGYDSWLIYDAQNHRLHAGYFSH